MEPVRVVSVSNDIKKFEFECASLMSDGYILDSSSSGSHGCETAIDEVYIATFVKPVPDIKVVAPSASSNTGSTCTPQIAAKMREVLSTKNLNIGQYREFIRQWERQLRACQ